MRRAIQLATMPETRLKISGGVSVPAALYALCDDGTIWAMDEGREWLPVKPIPQAAEPRTEAKAS